MSRAEQLVPRLRAWFQENPDEALTYDDMAAKFGCTREQARTAVISLRNEGMVRTHLVAMLDPARTRRAQA